MGKIEKKRDQVRKSRRQHAAATSLHCERTSYHINETFENALFGPKTRRHGNRCWRGSENRLVTRQRDHALVFGVAVKILLIQARREELEIATATVKVLFVLHSELEDERLVLVGKLFGHLLGDGVKPVILRCAESYTTHDGLA